MDYTGENTIVGEFIRQVRPKTRRTLHTLHFQLAQCAQVDRAGSGMTTIGSTQPKLYFFVLVQTHSRMLYTECPLA